MTLFYAITTTLTLVQTIYKARRRTQTEVDRRNSRSKEGISSIKQYGKLNKNMLTLTIPAYHYASIDNTHKTNFSNIINNWQTRAIHRQHARRNNQTNYYYRTHQYTIRHQTTPIWKTPKLARQQTCSKHLIRITKNGNQFALQSINKF
jgi:hypothetical protein